MPRDIGSGTRYGKRKLDEEAHAAQEETKVAASRGGTVYGKRKLDAGRAPVAPVETELNAASARLREVLEAREALPDIGTGSNGGVVKDDLLRAAVAVGVTQDELDGKAPATETGEGGENGAQEGGEGEAPADTPGVRAADAQARPSGADADANGYVSLDELKIALDADPGLLDKALEYEKRRPEIRGGAIRLFLQTEHAREGGPRAEVIAELEAALPG